MICFCLNMGVYRPPTSGQLQSQTDQICVATNEKRLYIFDSVMTAEGCKFVQDQKFCYENLPHKPYQVYWDEDRIYTGGKEGFHVINKMGQTLISYAYDIAKLARLGKLLPRGGDDMPLMAVYRDKCLVQVKSRLKAKFLVEGRDPKNKESNNIGYLASKPVFILDSSRTAIQLLMVEDQYVIIVYDVGVTIYHATEGYPLQDLGKID